jgi:hypothetical protein
MSFPRNNPFNAIEQHTQRKRIARIRGLNNRQHSRKFQVDIFRAELFERFHNFIERVWVNYFVKEEYKVFLLHRTKKLHFEFQLLPVLLIALFFNLQE